MLEYEFNSGSSSVEQHIGKTRIFLQRLKMTIVDLRMMVEYQEPF